MIWSFKLCSFVIFLSKEDEKAEILSRKSFPHNFKDIYSAFPCWSVTRRNLVFLCSIPFLLKIVEIKGKAQWVISAQYYKDMFEKCHCCRHDEQSLKCFSFCFFPSPSFFFFPWTSPRNVDLPSMQAKGAGGKTVATQDSGPDQKAICKARKAKKKSSTSNNVR